MRFLEHRSERLARRTVLTAGDARSGQSVLGEEFQGHADARLGLLDLQEVARAFDDAEVVAALDAERLIGGSRRRCAFAVRVGTDQLDRTAEGVGPMVADCVTEVVKTLHFDVVEGGSGDTTVRYPFVFRPIDS